MRFSSCVTILFSFLLFSLPEAYADDVSEGRNIFLGKCIACHAFTCNKQGPRLAGLFGRKVGRVEDYGSYSQGLKASDLVWTENSLDSFLKDPAKMFPQSVMVSNGKIETAAQRRKLIAFLKSEDPTVNICPQQ